MCASPFSFLRAGPPPPKVVLLSDGSFFTRSIPVAAGATEAEVAAQVELALEALSPFPLAQLYHGYFWKPGAERAFAFASYRRRFTTDQTAEWSNAQLVLPAFATVFGADVAPATSLVLSAPEGLTAVHWGSGAGPGQVVFRAIAPEATEEERVRARDDLLRGLGGSRAVIDLPAPPAPEAMDSDENLVFRADGFVSRLPAKVAAAVDVRDKAQLAALRRAKLRDLWLWRTAFGCAAALVLLLVGELALLGGNKLWQKTRTAKFNAQRPSVEKIQNAQNLAARIDELTTKRLLPMEMILLVAPKIPGSILFQSAVTNIGERDRITIEAKTENSGEIIAFKSALEALPECASVEISRQRNVPGTSTTTFTLSVIFKPGAVKPAPAT